MSTPQAAQSSETSEILATSSVVECDGGGGALGHPKVFLTFNNTDHLTCPYCSQGFRLAPGTKLGHGH